MVGAGFIKKKFSNAGKFALAFSIFSAQLLPIHQVAHAAGEFSSVYKIPKSGTSGKEISMKVPFKVKGGEPLFLNWQTSPNPNKFAYGQPLSYPRGKCKITSLNGNMIPFSFGTRSGQDVSTYEIYLDPATADYFAIQTPTSTNLVLDCKLDSLLSEGTLKVSQYLLNSKGMDSLPENNLIELKTGEMVILTFQGKAKNRLSIKVGSAFSGDCYPILIPNSAKSFPYDLNWDGFGELRSLEKLETVGRFIGPPPNNYTDTTELMSYTPEVEGAYVIRCSLWGDGKYTTESRYIYIEQIEGDLKLLRPQAIETEATAPAKCPVNKGPSKAPKISLAKNGLFIQYSENGFSDLPGCIDGFRVYATAMNPYTKKEFEEHGSWSIPIADCKPPVKGLISCLISFEKDWLLKLKNQDASLNTMAINASAVNSQGESIFSQRVFLFEKDPNLIAVACASMQASFANNLISSPSNAFATQAKWGAATGVAATLFTILITGGAVIPLVVGAGVAIAAASAAKEVSARRSTDIDKNAAKKFIEAYPVTALDLLILMKKSSNPDVRASSEIFQKAIQASDLMKIYRPLIGENNALTDFEVRKIIADEKLSRMKEVEASNFEKNGDKDLKSLFGKNSKFKGVLVKNASKISQGVDSFLVFKEQIQNNQSAENFILPNNCWFG